MATDKKVRETLSDGARLSFCRRKPGIAFDAMTSHSHGLAIRRLEAIFGRQRKNEMGQHALSTGGNSAGKGDKVELCHPCILQPLFRARIRTALTSGNRATGSYCWVEEQLQRSGARFWVTADASKATASRNKMVCENKGGQPRRESTRLGK